MSCQNCSLDLATALTMFRSKDESIKFLMDHDAIKESIKCSSCNNFCVLNKETLKWQCRKQQTYTENRRKKIKRCNFKQSLRTGSWFANAHLSPEMSCQFVTEYLLLNPPHQHFMMRDMQISSSTYCDWSAFIREVLEYWAFKNSAPMIGGRNKIVEIDEAKFGKRKYHCGRIIDGQWLFGGFDRETKSFFIEAVPDRSKQTLLAIIKRKIRPNSIIMSDCWKAYDCLGDQGKIS